MSIIEDIEDINCFILDKLKGDYSYTVFGACDMIKKERDVIFRELENINETPFLYEDHDLSFFHVIKETDFNEEKKLGGKGRYLASISIDFIIGSNSHNLKENAILALSECVGVTFKSKDDTYESISSYLGTRKVNYDKMYFSILNYTYTTMYYSKCKEYCFRPSNK